MRNDSKNELVEEYKNLQSMAQMLGGFGAKPPRFPLSKISTQISSSVSSTINGKTTYCGKVEINNRIFADTIVTNLDDKTFLICDFSDQNLNTTISAKIDNVNYQGKKIKVSDKEIIVDGYNVTVAAKVCFTLLMLHKREDNLFKSLPRDLINMLCTYLMPKNWAENFSQYPMSKRVVGHFFKLGPQISLEKDVDSKRSLVERASHAN